MMSGVMIKLGIYGIVRVGVEFLGASTAWWGWMVLAFGAVSAVLGAFYALAEHDIKRLLAYSSVENIGIILMGVGAGMIGIATGQPVLATVGLLAALYHLLNHAVFKGLMFLGSGALLDGHINFDARRERANKALRLELAARRSLSKKPHG
jgi:hydrogenase-4 component B